MDSLSEQFETIIIRKRVKKNIVILPQTMAKPKKNEGKTLPADKYTREILRMRYNLYRDTYINTAEIIKTTGLPIRHQNPPEDVSENMVKFIIHYHDKDPSCKWAKCIGLNGDLYSDKYPIDSPIEIKALTSDGPSSFGPKKKFGVIYFLDMRKWLDDKFNLWRVNLTNESPEWKQIKMNKIQTYEEQCEEGRRPHISWDNIHAQMPDKCTKVYEGTFEGIFMPPVIPSAVSQ
jgi:hypothetical protein